MKKVIASIAAILIVAPVFAGEVSVGRLEMGSGTPGVVGLENAPTVVNDIYHAPEYLPYHPTAATIWPRVVEVECNKLPSGALDCEGYRWNPGMGRGEYIFITPVVKQPAKTEIRTIVTPVEVIKEVPVKKIRE